MSKNKNTVPAWKITTRDSRGKKHGSIIYAETKNDARALATRYYRGYQIESIKGNN